MQKCRMCGKSSEFELCILCYRKSLGLKGNNKTTCIVCGEPAFGYRCNKCRSAAAEDRVKNNVCIDCGKQVSRKYGGKEHRCNACAIKRKVAENKAAAMIRNATFLTCEYCGKQFQYRRVGKSSHPVRFCSQSCSSKHRHKIHGNTKEAMEMAITDYIKKAGFYVSHAALKNALHISRQQLRRYGIDLVKLNTDLGMVEKVGPVRKARAEHKTGWHIPEIEVRRDDPEGLELRNTIVAWLKASGKQQTVRSILRQFHIDFYSTWRRFGFDVVDLHREAGIPYSRTSSWPERYVLDCARERFGTDNVVAQKRFVDLVSDKGWSLRFDMYIKPYNCLIEVDGEQHYDEAHSCYRGSNHDQLKADYAKTHNIRLEHIRIAPSATFKQRVSTLFDDICKMDILKESELLEAVQPELF